MAKKALIRIPVGNILVSVSLEPHLHILRKDVEKMAPTLIKRDWVTELIIKNGNFYATGEPFLKDINWDCNQRARDLLILAANDAVPATLLLDSVFEHKRTILIANYDNFGARSYSLYNWRLFRKKTNNPMKHFAFDHAGFSIISSSNGPSTSFMYAELCLGRSGDRHF